MARPNRSDDRRKQLLPIVAAAFAELGYRRATTAALARRCTVRENVLYRLWPDKRAMFVASIEYVYEQAAGVWQRLLQENAGEADAAIRILEYEAQHYGESGLQRIIFAGLSETDEPEIRDALRRMYRRFHRFVRGQVGAHRDGKTEKAMLNDTVAAWGIIGLGNLANVARQLGVLSDRGRRQMFSQAGRLLLEGRFE